jgi:hypothetical protein
MRNYLKVSRIVIICSVLFAGCSDNPHAVDVSNIDADVSVKRFEADLDEASNVEDVLQLKEEYGVFYEAYSDWIMVSVTGGGRVEPREKARRLLDFTATQEWDTLLEVSNARYANFSDVRSDLNQAFRYLKYHFPEATDPEIITYLATFEVGAFTIEESGQIGIGLDMFLGADFPVYQWLDPNRFPRYRTRKFREDYIVPLVVKGVADLYAKPGEVRTCIDQMILAGKRLYFMDAVLPFTPDSLKIGYLEGQIEWCEQNEFQIWSHFLENNLLFSSQESEYMRYFNDGPFTSAKNMPREASPRVGEWVGWQLVRTYMEKNPGVSLKELMGNTRYQEIFTESRYKP